MAKTTTLRRLAREWPMGAGMIRTTITAVLVAACLASCANGADTFTLYRNSPYGVTRIHWATFNASESDPSYNLNNCQMAARLLNANVTASAKAEGKVRDTSLGFWCEPGSYKKDGPIPASFAEAFPTDA